VLIGIFAITLFGLGLVQFFLLATEVGIPGRISGYLRPVSMIRGERGNFPDGKFFPGVPDYLQSYYLYNASAGVALEDFNSWVNANGVSVPLFEDRMNMTNATPPKICVSIITAHRKGSPFKYIVQSTMSLLMRMDYRKNKDSVYIHVFNVDADPSHHSDVDHIRHLVPVTNIKGVIEESGSGFQVETKAHESADTAAIMRLIEKMGCEYPIFIEDDALATEGWVDSVNLAIEELKHQEEWMAIKLFSARQEYPPLSRKGITNYDQGFNMVATLFNPKFLVEFAERMEDNVRECVRKEDISAHTPKDLLLQEMASSHGSSIKSFEPCIFQHTGVYSSVIERSVSENAVHEWYLSTKYFESEGKPIVFDSNQFHR